MNIAITVQLAAGLGALHPIPPAHRCHIWVCVWTATRGRVRATVRLEPVAHIPSPGALPHGCPSSHGEGLQTSRAAPAGEFLDTFSQNRSPGTRRGAGIDNAGAASTPELLYFLRCTMHSKKEGESINNSARKEFGAGRVHCPIFCQCISTKFGFGAQW